MGQGFTTAVNAVKETTELEAKVERLRALGATAEHVADQLMRTLHTLRPEPPRPVEERQGTPALVPSGRFAEIDHAMDVIASQLSFADERITKINGML